MQEYTYEKGGRYPVEHLVFSTAPEHVEEFLDVDHEVWTLGEAGCGPAGRIPFLYKEVWLNDNRPGEIHIIFVWESLESWQAVGEKEIQDALSARFDAKFAHPYRLTRCIHGEENFGLHRYSRFARV